MTKVAITNIQRKINVPDGQYQGTWEQWWVDFEVDGQQYQAVADKGTREPTSCTVIVKNGSASIQLPAPAHA